MMVDIQTIVHHGVIAGNFTSICYTCAGVCACHIYKYAYNPYVFTCMSLYIYMYICA